VKLIYFVNIGRRVFVLEMALVNLVTLLLTFNLHQFTCSNDREIEMVSFLTSFYLLLYLVGR